MVVERGAGSTRSVPWKGAVVGGTLVMAVAALAGSLYVRLFLPRQLPVRDVDRDLLITIRDVQPHLAKFTPRTDGELVKKTRLANGTHVLRYEYLHPDGQRDLYLLCRIEVHPSRNDAREAYGRLVSQEMPEAPFAGVSYTEIDSSIPWADSARLTVLARDGKPRGHSFLCRVEDRILCVELFGLHFDEGEPFQDLVFPRVTDLPDYEP